MYRPLKQIAQEIKKDWKSVNYAADPYLSAMCYLSDMNDKYMMDSAKSIVAYFLSNASSWRGDKAREIKKELNAMLNGKKYVSPVMVEGKQNKIKNVLVNLEKQLNEGFLDASQQTGKETLIQQVIDKIEEQEDGGYWHLSKLLGNCPVNALKEFLNK